MTDELAVQWVRGTIRAQMAKNRFSYAMLTRALRDTFHLEGDEWNEKNVANKVARGHFSAVFFVQCLEAMGVKDLRLDMAGDLANRHLTHDAVHPGDQGAEARERARKRERRNSETRATK